MAQAGGEPLFVVANLDTCVVSLRVYERDVAAAVVGAPIRLTLQAYPGASWEAVVDYVSPRLDDKTRTVLVRATLQNDGRLKPGLFGTANILPLLPAATKEAGGDGGDGAVVDAAAVDAAVDAAVVDAGAHAIVPVDAVQRLPTGAAVFVPGVEPGSFRVVPVVVAGSRHGEVEIATGLEPGDDVVVEGAFVLKSEHQRAELGEGHAH